MAVQWIQTEAGTLVNLDHVVLIKTTYADREGNVRIVAVWADESEIDLASGKTEAMGVAMASIVEQLNRRA